MCPAIPSASSSPVAATLRRRSGGTTIGAPTWKTASPNCSTTWAPRASAVFRRRGRLSRRFSPESSCGAVLGRAGDENPLAGQYLELADSNFAEVESGARNRSRTRALATFQIRGQEVDQCSTSEFRFIQQAGEAAQADGV